MGIGDLLFALGIAVVPYSVKFPLIIECEDKWQALRRVFFTFLVDDNTSSYDLDSHIAADAVHINTRVT